MTIAYRIGQPEKPDLQQKLYFECFKMLHHVVFVFVFVKHILARSSFVLFPLIIGGSCLCFICIVHCRVCVVFVFVLYLCCICAVFVFLYL